LALYSIPGGSVCRHDDNNVAGGAVPRGLTPPQRAGLSPLRRCDSPGLVPNSIDRSSWNLSASHVVHLLLVESRGQQASMQAS